jgi:hypothetical protein
MREKVQCAIDACKRVGTCERGRWEGGAEALWSWRPRHILRHRSPVRSVWRINGELKHSVYFVGSWHEEIPRKDDEPFGSAAAHLPKNLRLRCQVQRRSNSGDLQAIFQGLIFLVKILPPEKCWHAAQYFHGCSSSEMKICIVMSAGGEAQRQCHRNLLLHINYTPQKCVEVQEVVALGSNLPLQSEATRENNGANLPFGWK